MNEGNVALACMQALVDELASHGLERACVSPGSRSTPIALALWRHPCVNVHVHLDERSSAFFALGLSKATGRPVAVACTSGTAAANLFPAVVEASMSRVPLILLTADRPPELRGVGANQAIDQLHLFGRYVKRFVDAEVPGDRPDLARWRSLAGEAIRGAVEGAPGPVHLNLPFREPLVPSEEVVPAADPRPASVAWRPAPREPRPEEIASLAEKMGEKERGVILAGSLRLDARPIVDLARSAGWLLIAEPTSGVRAPGALAAGLFLLADRGFTSSHEPDVVLQFGAAPTSRAGLAFAAGAKELVIVDPDGLVADPARHASRTIRADPAMLGTAVVERLPVRGETPWLREWRDADACARRAVDELMDSWDEPFEGRVARDLAACLPDGSTLVVGSSMPVRDLDFYMLPRGGLRVLGNRGASGIDGFVSTVLGLAATGSPTVALCGDLTLLHDVGALLWGAKRGQDAVFVVPNNVGGVIFSFLPQRSLPELDDLFVTPHGLDLANVADAAGAPYLLVDRAADLGPAVEKASDAGGVWIVEVPSDGERNVARHADVNAAVADALSG